MFTALPRSVVVRVGALVLGAGVTRVRIKEFAAGVLIHTSLATVGFVMCDRAPGQAAPNAVVTITISMLALFAAYITERRERVSLLREHEAALSSQTGGHLVRAPHVWAARSWACPFMCLKNVLSK